MAIFVESKEPLVVPKITPRVITPEEKVLAQMVWGEARGCSKKQQAACVWCVLNRVAAGHGDIVSVVTAPFQFQGWSENNPVDEEILQLVRDILDGNVPRVLPEDYMWFIGDGINNYFTNEWRGSNYWDWSYPDPYTEEVS